MRYSLDQAAQDAVRKNRAAEAELAAYQAEFHAERVARLIEKGIDPQASVPLEVLQERAKLLRARAVLRRSQSNLTNDEVKQIRLNWLDGVPEQQAGYIEQLEREHFRLSLDKEDLEDDEPDPEKRAELMEAFEESLKLISVCHSFAKEKRALERGKNVTKKPTKPR